MTLFRPRHLSVSSVSLYVKCPAQWKARYVDRLVIPTTAPQATGIAFHKALEAEHLGQDSERAWIAAANIAEADLRLSGQTLTMTKARGLDLLNLYRERGLGGAVGEPERRFLLPFPSPKIPVRILGYLDVAIPRNREYRDWKTTAGTFWTQMKVDLEPQKEVYGWAYQQLYHHRPARALWCVFNTALGTLDEYPSEPSPDGFRLFEREAEAAWAGISAGKFEGCGVCEMCKEPIGRLSKGPSFVWDE